MAKNTNVEWSHLKFGVGNLQSSILTTSHGTSGDFDESVLLRDDLLVMSLFGYDRNHPAQTKIPHGSDIPLDLPEYRSGDVVG